MTGRSLKFTIHRGACRKSSRPGHLSTVTIGQINGTERETSLIHLPGKASKLDSSDFKMNLLNFFY